MLERGHQHDVQQLRDHQHHDGDAHRRAHVLAGVEARRQHLDRHQADQASAVADQRQGDLRHVAVLESAVVEQGGDQRLGEHQQRDRSRHGQQHDQAQAPVEHGGIALGVVAGPGAGQLRHQHHAQRDAQHGRRKLHQPVGIAEPGHAARREPGSDLRVDQERDLRHADAQQAGSIMRSDLPRARVVPGRAQRGPAQADARQQAEPVQGRDLDRQLQHAAQHHAPAMRVDRLDAHATRTRARPARPRRSSPGSAAPA